MKHSGILELSASACGGNGSRLDSPSECSHEGHELVERVRTSPRQHRTKENCACAEDVLLPLYTRIVFPTAREETRLHDTHGWEELQGDGQEDGDRILEVSVQIQGNGNKEWPDIRMRRQRGRAECVCRCGAQTGGVGFAWREARALPAPTTAWRNRGALRPARAPCCETRDVRNPRTSMITTSTHRETARPGQTFALVAG